jgi:hypothetical protein
LCDEEHRLLERCVSRTVECIYDLSFPKMEYRGLTPSSAAPTEHEIGGAAGSLSRLVERTLFLRFKYC